jgi:hypothetical protein
VDQARIADVLAGLGELPAHRDALLAVRLSAWRHRWQNRRTVGDRHLFGDHCFHQHLGDVGGVAAEKYDPPAPQPEEGPLGDRFPPRPSRTSARRKGRLITEPSAIDVRAGHLRRTR